MQHFLAQMLWSLLLVALADARSTGIYIASDVAKGCNFEDFAYTSQWGCQTRTWNYTTGPTARQFCQDANLNGGKFMWWTGAPLPATQFTMRTGDGNPVFDATTYVPGQFVAVYIRALQFDVTYAGLLLYATMGANRTKVGDWIVPAEVSPQFGVAPDASLLCDRSVMHINVEEKPYVVKFIFRAPPAGTGPITFKCMLKTGPPNPTDYGNFERLADVTLQEAPAPTDPTKWVELPTGKSCASYCQGLNNSEPCSDVTLSSTMQGLQPNPLDSIYPCHGAVFQDCTGNPRVTQPGDFCTYHPASCPTGASCAAVATADTPLFCRCNTPVTGAPSTAPSQRPPVNGTPSTAPSQQSSPTPVNEISASPRSAAPSGLAALLTMPFVVVGLMGGSRSHMAVLATVALLMASSVPSAQAHNWLEGTRGRAYNLGASKFCSPTLPQVNRNAIHLQVGAGQNFVVEWVAGHGDFTYFVLISDDARANASKLTRATMNSYLAACPYGGFANDTTKPLQMKYHRFRPDFNLDSSTQVEMQNPTSPMYRDVFEPNMIRSGAVWDAFSLNGSRPTSLYRSDANLGLVYTGSQCANCVPNFTLGSGPNATLAQYKPAYMTNDRICAYTNATNPWIIAIYRFSHQEVSASVATAVLQFPPGTFPGRYQVHYKWASYCDVMDVDVKSTVVTTPYGTPIAVTNATYDIAHHCLFNKPRLVGDCVEVVTTFQQCQAVCSSTTGCKAFQLLPLQLNNTLGDSLGLFPETAYVPWTSGNNNGYFNGNTSFCDKSRFIDAKPGSYVCYPIYSFQDDFNSARPLWSITDDTNHQGFYGTCYIKARAVQFLTFTRVAEDLMTDFRFGSKCIPCDNIGQDVTNPRWGPQLDYCTDCTKQTVAPRQNSPTIPTWTKRTNGTFVDPVKWLNPAGTPFAMADECALLASRDSACSKFVMYSSNRTTMYSGRGGVLPTNTNLNNTASFRLYNTSFAWHYTNYALTSSYYRSCACLLGNVTTLPAVDDSCVANACAGVSTLLQCAYKDFEIFELA